MFRNVMDKFDIYKHYLRYYQLLTIYALANKCAETT